MKTALTWESRRHRAFYARLAAAIIGILAIFIGTMIAMALLFSAAAAIRGSLSGFDSAMFSDYASSAWRGFALASFGVIVGFCASFTLRYSIGGTGFVAAWAAVEGIVWKINQGAPELSPAVGMYILGLGYDNVDPLNPVSQTKAIGSVVISALILVGVADFVFRRRDVSI